MRAVLTHKYFILAARLLLGFVFVVASIDKISDPTAFAQSINNYKLIPLFIVNISATVLPWVELLAGFGLLFGVNIRGSNLIVWLLLFVFILAIVSALDRGLDISCGCLTQDPAATKIGWSKVIENIGLLVLSTLLFFVVNIRELGLGVSSSRRSVRP